jgi:hypothetical protein
VNALFLVNTRLDMENQNSMKTELELSGLDPEKLEFMDIEERKKALRAAGLDPESYDF